MRQYYQRQIPGLAPPGQGEIARDAQAIGRSIGNPAHFQRFGNPLVDIAERLGLVAVEIDQGILKPEAAPIDAHDELLGVAGHRDKTHMGSFEGADDRIPFGLHARIEEHVVRVIIGMHATDHAVGQAVFDRMLQRSALGHGRAQGPLL